MISLSSGDLGFDGSELDTIADFVHGFDIIDTSAINSVTAIGGLITGGTQVDANSIVWIQSGLDTIVYGNSSGARSKRGGKSGLRWPNIPASKHARWIGRP